MIPVGALVRVMNAAKSDSILVGTVMERWTALGYPRLRLRPLSGEDQWAPEDACEVILVSDL
jgi:hypothetical protein